MKLYSVLLLLAIGCNQQPPPPTSLSGQVFATGTDDDTFVARGRTVTLLRATSKMQASVKANCSQLENIDRSINDKFIKGALTQRIVAEFAEKQKTLDMVAPGMAIGGTIYAETVATTTTDIQGSFSFPDVPTGQFLVFSSAEYGGRLVYWLASVTIKEAMENRLVLGPDASRWRNMCIVLQFASASR